MRRAGGAAPTDLGDRLPRHAGPLGLLLVAGLAACGGGRSSGGTPELPSAISARLERDATASPARIVVVAEVRGAAGNPLSGQDVRVAAGEAAVAPVEELGGGRYRAVVTPPWPSGVLPITASVGTAGPAATLTALVLPQVGADWGQPEAVPGLVNTPAYEDGIEIAPDGEWLFVGSYSPVDVFTCLSCADPSCAACQTVIGPYGAPARPGMLGAWRIESPTRVANRCPKLCFTGPDGGDVPNVPLPPVSGFGFRRQPDGSFAEPFVIGLDADGCNAPFGYSLVAPPQGTSAEVVFAGTFPGSSTGNDLFWAPLVLGSPNVLASFACPAGNLTLVDSVAAPLMLDPLAGTQGNPHLRGGLLFFDDEYSSSPPALLVTRPGGALPAATFPVSQRVPLAPGEDVRQPFFDPPHLYFTREFRVARSRLDGDPAAPDGWSTPTTELAGEPLATTRAGAIFVVGEPSVAHRPDGTYELYFVYGVRTATGGVALDAGRVVGRAPSPDPGPDESVTVDAAVARGAATQRASGLLLPLSATAPPDALIDPLAPRLFRTAQFYEDAFDAYGRMSARAPVVMVVGIAGYFTCPGCGDCTTCEPLPGEGGDFTAWEARVTGAVEGAMGAARSYLWDVWNEPDLTPWPDGAWPSPRYLDTWAAAVRRIRSIDPAATVVGPSTAFFDAAAMRSFLDWASENDVLPDVLSWHEFGPSFGLDGPASVPAHVDELRAHRGGLVSRFQINEYMGPDETYDPGAAVHFFANLERAGVESAARSCWDGDCFDTSLAGLLTRDALLPRSVWWAFEAYAATAGELVEVTPSASFDAVAALSGAGVRVLAGNHSGTWLAAELRFRGVDAATFPGGCVRVGVEHIPNTLEHALSAPVATLDEERPYLGGEVVVELPLSSPGDAWVVELRACSGP